MTWSAVRGALSVAGAALAAAPGAALAGGGDAVVARARAAESAEIHLLSRTPVALHTNGRFGDGTTTHTFESYRRVEYRDDGSVSNTFERGQVDGKPATEAELRKAMGIKEDPKDHDDVLTWALAPLSSRDMDVTVVPGGSCSSVRRNWPDGTV